MRDIAAQSEWPKRGFIELQLGKLQRRSRDTLRKVKTQIEGGGEKGPNATRGKEEVKVAMR